MAKGLYCPKHDTYYGNIVPCPLCVEQRQRESGVDSQPTVPTSNERCAWTANDIRCTRTSGHPGRHEFGGVDVLADRIATLEWNGSHGANTDADNQVLELLKELRQRRADETPAEPPFAENVRLERDLQKALEERDANADYADMLTNMIGVLVEQDMGEHTSGNFPWENAIEAMREAIGRKPSNTAKGREAREVAHPAVRKVGPPDPCDSGESVPSETPVANYEVTYACGCRASGPTPLPDYCGEHGPFPVKTTERTTDGEGA